MNILIRQIFDSLTPNVLEQQVVREKLQPTVASRTEKISRFRAIFYSKSESSGLLQDVKADSEREVYCG